MSIASQATQQKFPFSYNAVFDGLAEVIPSSGMSIISQDKVIGRITASSGMSLFSWGENLTIVVDKIDDNSTSIGIESALKFGASLAGSHRHQLNFNKIIDALSNHLQGKRPLNNSPGFSIIKTVIVVLILLFLICMLSETGREVLKKIGIF